MGNYSDALDGIFYALADSTRRAVIRRLSRGPASVTELAEPFDMALPSFMKHLAVLEGAGLIESRKLGRVRTCRMRPRSLASAETWLAGQRAQWEQQTQRLADHVEKMEKRERR